MKILMLVPQPFYQERGSPIAVKLLVETLCEAGHSVDLLTYHEGENISLAGLRLYRITNPPFVKDISIGFSWKKVFCDVFLIKEMIKMIKQNSYQVIHAVEETIFPGLILKYFFKYKLIYDMDSSMADQLIEKYDLLRFFKKPLYKMEGWAIQGSDFTFPVCRNLAEKIQRYLPEEKICILQDVPLKSSRNTHPPEDLRELLSIDECMALYVGNLEHYQGIGLMLEGMEKVPKRYHYSLVVIGGKKHHIDKYASKAEKLGLSQRVNFIGPRPLSSLSYFLSQADILISPRSKGENTPMKIYSYLASGKPVLATRIKSHTQVMDSACSMLVDPTPAAIAQGLIKLISKPDLRNSLGQNGKQLAKNCYSIEAYKKKLLDSYAFINQTALFQ